MGRVAVAAVMRAAVVARSASAGWVLLLGVASAGCYRAKPVSVSARMEAALREASSSVPTVEASKATSLPLTLDTALAEARALYPALAVQRAVAATAAAAVSDAGAWDNPEIRIQTSRFDEYAGGEPGLRLAFRAPLPRPGVTTALEAVSEADARVERARLMQLEKEVDAETRALYYEVLLAAAELEATEAERAAQEAWLVEVASQTQAGQSTALDLARRELVVADAEADVQRARHALKSAEVAMGVQVGRGQLSVADLATPLPSWESDPLLRAPPPSATSTEEQPEYFGATPALEEAAAAVDAADASLWLEQSEAWPWFRFVQLAYELETNAPAGQAFTALVAIDIPLFSQNAGGIDAAEAAQREADIAFDAAARAAHSRWIAARAALEAAAYHLASYRDTTIRAAEHAVSEARRAEAAGTASGAQRAEIEAQAARIKRRWIDALRTYCEARLALLGES